MVHIIWKVALIYFTMNVLSSMAEIDQGHGGRRNDLEHKYPSLEHKNPFLSKIRPMNGQIFPREHRKSVGKSEGFAAEMKFKHRRQKSRQDRKPISTEEPISNEISHRHKDMNKNFLTEKRQKRSTSLDVNQLTVVLFSTLNQTEKKLDEFSDQMLKIQEAMSETNGQLRRNFLPRLRSIERRLNIQSDQKWVVNCTGKQVASEASFEKIRTISERLSGNRDRLQDEFAEWVRNLVYCKLPLNDTYGEDKRMLLHIAAEIDEAETARLLMDKGADLKAQTTEDKTPLHLAARNNSVYVLSVLIENQANLSAVDKTQRTALFDAAETDAAEAAQILIDNKASINASDKDDHQPIHIAALNNSPKVLKLLIDHGTPTNEVSKSGTPLQAAIKTDAVEAAKILLDNGVDPTVADFFGDAAIHFAARVNASKVIPLLIQYKVPVDSENSLGYTALHWAAHKNTLAAAKVLLENGADIHSRTMVDSTPLHTAAQHKAVDVLKFLLEKGANIQYKDNSNQTAYEMARRVRCDECMAILERYGAKE